MVRGITIRAEATLSIIALLVMWSFWSLFTTANSGVTVVATAIASTALFLGSILAQEIARARSETSRIERSRCHAARVWRGNRITSEIKRPCGEFALTIVGPWTSIVLGFGFGLATFGATSARIGTFAEVTGQLGWLNVILGVFNLLPEVPLDGGHLPEATVWRITLNHSRATAKSTRAGQILGALIIVFGLNELVFVTGDFIVGRPSSKRGFESRRVWRRANHWHDKQSQALIRVVQSMGSRSPEIGVAKE